MRKITIGFIVLAILALTAFLIVSCTAKTETEIVEQTQPVETAEQPVLPEETGEPEAPPLEKEALPVIEISLDDYYQTTSQCFFNGEVTTDGNPLETSFDIYCAGSKVGSSSSDNHGAFDFSVSKAKCPEGVDAWIVADGEESKHITVSYEEESVDNGVRTFALATSAPPAGVPEFSILTLGLAVVIGGLGLAYLRKN